MFSKLVFAGVMLLLCISCTQERGCYNTQHNPILASNIYNTKEYQAELYRLIKESPEVDYYYEMQEEILGRDYLVVTAYGDAFCGKLCLVISEEEALQIDNRNGYQGAQLIGLKYKPTKADYGWSALIYHSIEYMVH